MKKLLSIFAVAAVIMLLATSCKKDSYNTFATISGTVMDRDNGEPLGNVSLTLTPGGLNTYTGSDGSFQFNDIDAQQYTLQAQKSGYKANRLNNINALAGETTRVSITLEKQQP